MLDTQSPGWLVRQDWMPLDGASSLLSGALAYAFARTGCSAGQRYDIVSIFVFFLSINFVFPHFFLLSLFQMCHCWHLVSDAHVWAVVVVEMYEAFYDAVGVLEGVEARAIDTLYLYYSVGALGDGVVRRVVVLRHGDGDVMLPEHLHVVVAAVLHAPVGVVDQSLKLLAAAHGHGLADGHLQGLHRDGGLERAGQCPAHYLVRIGIGDEVQVAHVTAGQGDVGDVGHPQPVGCRGNEALYQVPPLVVAVVGVRRVSGFRLGKHQTLAAKQHEETVTPWHEVTTEQRDEHQPQLQTAYAGILPADFPDGLHDLPLMLHLLLYVGLRLVEGLTTMAK